MWSQCRICKIIYFPDEGEGKVERCCPDCDPLICGCGNEMGHFEESCQSCQEEPVAEAEPVHSQSLVCGCRAEKEPSAKACQSCQEAAKSVRCQSCLFPFDIFPYHENYVNVWDTFVCGLCLDMLCCCHPR